MAEPTFSLMRPTCPKPLACVDSSWTDTGQSRCVANVVEVEQRSNCGTLRWNPTTTVCGFCPSMRLACAGGAAGFGFHEMDPPDPAATVVMEPCDGDTSVDPIRIYPTAGPGHTVRVNKDDGTLWGYAANRSDCAPDCGCPGDPVINVTNHFSPTTKVAAPVVNNEFSPTTNVAAPNVDITLPAPTLVATSFNNEGVLKSTLSDGSTIESNPLPSC